MAKIENKRGAGSFSVSARVMLYYVLPSIGVAFLAGGPMSILQSIYAKHHGLLLSEIAMVLLLARLFDAITDPLIGYYSDRYFECHGTRKPFVLGGGILFIVCSYFLYAPPEEVTLSYFLVAFLGYYLALTLFDIPHSAWGSELVRDSQQRVKLFSARSVTGNIGLLLFFAIPLLPMFSSSEFTPETMRWSAILAGILLLPTLIVCVLAVPDGQHLEPVEKSHNNNILKQWVNIYHNKPLLLYLVAFLVSMTGAGMCVSLLFIFVDAFLGLGSEFSMISLLGLLIGTASVPIWYRVSLYCGERVMWCIAVILIAASAGFIGLVEPGADAYLWFLIASAPLYFGFAGLNIFSPVVLSSVIDYGRLKFGEDCAATYFSLHGLLTKMSWGLGSAASFGLIAWYGFDASALHQTTGAIFGLRLSISVIPMCVVLLSLPCIYFFPISTHKQTVVRKALARRNLRNQMEIRTLNTSTES